MLPAHKPATKEAIAITTINASVGTVFVVRRAVNLLVQHTFRGLKPPLQLIQLINL
jgi:hypothetical protein